MTEPAAAPFPSRDAERTDRRWALLCAALWLQTDPVAGEERVTEAADYFHAWLRGELGEQP